MKGVAAERVTLHSGFTSCQITFAVGQRIGVVYNAGGEIFSCSYVDPDALIAASALPQPSGTPRYTVAIAGVSGTDTVQLGARGQIAGYGFPQGRVLGLARCGRGVVEAVRGSDGKVLVNGNELPLRTVLGISCTGNGARVWVTGSDGEQVQLVSVSNGKVDTRMRRPAAAASIAGSRAYYVHGRDLVRIVPQGGGRLRSARAGFTSISGNGDRVAGRLRDGRSAQLNVRTGKLVTRRDGGRLTWLDDSRLLGSDAVYDSGLRRLRAVTTRGTLVGVVEGAAFFADGKVLYRLAPGAKRAVRFAVLPGRATSVVAAPTPRALNVAWHSCEESANSPLTS